MKKKYELEKGLKDINYKKRPWWKKLLLLPFKLLWKVVKVFLGIITLGMLDSIINGNKE